MCLLYIQGLGKSLQGRLTNWLNLLWVDLGQTLFPTLIFHSCKISIISKLASSNPLKIWIFAFYWHTDTLVNVCRSLSGRIQGKFTIHTCGSVELSFGEPGLPSNMGAFCLWPNFCLETRSGCDSLWWLLKSGFRLPSLGFLLFIDQVIFQYIFNFVP